MTDEEYLERHIPHRVNLLLTFRERYSKLSATSIDPEYYRDFHRCSKDISMLMVRFFLCELGVHLPRKKCNKPDEAKPVRHWKSRCGIRRLTLNEVKEDRRFASVFEVLKAANRAVAHLEEIDIDHPIRLDEDLSILFDAITFTEEKIKEKIFYPEQRTTFEKVMALPDNDMMRSVNKQCSTDNFDDTHVI